MIHDIEIVHDEYGKAYIKRIIFDMGNISEYFPSGTKGYEGMNFRQLMECEEITVCSTNRPIEGVEVMEFRRPISIDRLLIMFGKLRFEGMGLEEFVEADPLSDEIGKDENYVR